MKEYSDNILKEAISELLKLEARHQNQDLISEKTGKKMKVAEVEAEFERIIQEVVERYEV